MIVMPAIDLQGGRVVQLVGGDPDAVAVSRTEAPLEVAQQWWDAGARRLHVVDLDRALGRGGHEGTIHDLIAAAPGPVQVGGGLRDEDAVAAVLEAGAAQAIVGTRAVEDQEFLERICRRHGRRICVAVDSRGRDVVVDGWRRATGEDVAACAQRMAAAGVGAVLHTEVSGEGRMEGPAVDIVADVVRAGLPLYASGGVGSEADLQVLEAAGAAGAVVGMALYTGRISPDVLRRRA